MKPKPPQTVAALIAAIDQIVEVIDGPRRAYFEVGSERVVYQTWATSAIGEAEDTEALLCMWFWANFLVPFTEEMIEDHNHILFWRSRPYLQSFIDEKGRVCTALRARLACPGIDFPFATKREGEPMPSLN